MISMGHNAKSFTLIELLIVVLIIAILAAIAIPNFLEFQTRAKVARVKSDMRNIATALEAYCVDEGTYPASRMAGGIYHYAESLTTPIAYLTSVPIDPFGENIGVQSGTYHLLRFEYGAGKEGSHVSQYDNYPNDVWLLDSAGPDGIEDTHTSRNPFNTLSFPWMWADASYESQVLAIVYDPTNGTTSRGQIQRTGGVPLHRRPLNVWSAAVSR
jgi:type II secretion system protein G